MPCEAAGLLRLRERVAALGWRCLTVVWQGYQVRSTFECAWGHRFDLHVATVMYQSRRPACPVCDANAIRQQFCDRLGERGFACLEVDLLGLRVQHRFRCALGHDWPAEGSKVLGGSWCGRCAELTLGDAMRRGDGLARLQTVVAGHGGYMPDHQYVDLNARYRFC